MGLEKCCPYATCHPSVNGRCSGIKRSYLERIPAGRWGLPDDLMGPAVFLASAASDYVNGFTLAVDGGWLAR
ncbi:MAG: SDR family oxidoreductase [Sodalis sp. (in: enterobacteria)]